MVMPLLRMPSYVGQVTQQSAWVWLVQATKARQDAERALRERAEAVQALGASQGETARLTQEVRSTHPVLPTQRQTHVFQYICMSVCVCLCVGVWVWVWVGVRVQLAAIVHVAREREQELAATQAREAVWARENELRVQAQATAKQLQARVAELEAAVAQRDEALVEMAQELGRSKLKVSALAQFKASAQQEGWVDEGTVDQCQLCKAPFSLVNRKVCVCVCIHVCQCLYVCLCLCRCRYEDDCGEVGWPASCSWRRGAGWTQHHCRRCGGVFCSDCSGQRMKLPSSAAPERVCDTCAHWLLNRHTAE
jgi:hypothetical protein